MNEPATESSDAALVGAVLHGATHRFSELVLRHDASVRRVLSRGTGRAEVHEDLVQETWCQAYQSLPQLGRPEKLRAWVLRIAQRCLAAHHRREQVRSLQPLEVEPAASPVVSTQWVWEEVAVLHGSFAEVLLMHYRDGRSYQEMSRALRVPISTIRGRLYEARQALSRRLERKEPRR